MKHYLFGLLSIGALLQGAGDQTLTQAPTMSFAQRSMLKRKMQTRAALFHQFVRDCKPVEEISFFGIKRLSPAVDKHTVEICNTILDALYDFEPLRSNVVHQLAAYGPISPAEFEAMEIPRAITIDEVVYWREVKEYQE